MKYSAVIAIIDGQPDQSGDILSNNFELPTKPIPVTDNFEHPPIGHAIVSRQGVFVVAEIEFFDDVYYPMSLVENWHGVVGGVTVKRNDNVIEEWKLKEIGLTSNPCDDRLPKLKVSYERK